MPHIIRPQQSSQRALPEYCFPYPGLSARIFCDIGTNVDGILQQICNYMIFYRVAQGRAWRKDTISGTQLRFGSSNNSSGGPIQSMPSLRRTDKYGGSASDHGAMSKEVYDSWHPRKSEV